MRNFVLGFFAGAAALYSSMCFHVVRADNGTHMVAKTALTFRDSYVDVRKFDVAEWREHVPLAEALLKANKKELMGDGVENSVRNAWDNLWEPRRR